MRRKTKASAVALCGVLGALALAVLLPGGVIPAAAISCPVLASLVLIPVYLELGRKWGLLWYLTVAILGLVLAPVKECAILFLCFGPYPMLRKSFGRLPLSRLVKHLYLNAVVLGAYGVMIFVLELRELVAEYAQTGKWMLGLLLVMANVSFVLYDLLIGRVEVLYLVRVKPKL